MQIAQNIKRLRQERNISQNQLARELNITPQAVSKWENGQASPDIELLPKLAKFFAVSIDELFESTQYERVKSIKDSIDDCKGMDSKEFVETEEFLSKLLSANAENADALVTLGNLYIYYAKLLMDVLKEVGLIGNDERDKAKLDLLLDAGGRNFSGGELQRISLARLYLLHTNFVILDESMANIDLNTTVKLLTSMLATTDKTIIYISHQEDQRIYDLFEHILTIEDHKVRKVK